MVIPQRPTFPESLIHDRSRCCLGARTLAACLILCVCSPHILAAPGITARYDPDKPNRKTAVFWLAYLVARMAYHEEHKLPIPPMGEIIPPFEEEVSGRRMAIGAYRDFKKSDSTLRDPYWESMAGVETAGFLAPYVWTFHRRREWPPAKEPRNLAAFNVWRRTTLNGHTPQTYGSLEGNKAK